MSAVRTWSLACMFVLLGGVPAVAAWVPVDGSPRGPARVTATNPAADRVLITVTLPGYDLREVDVDGVTHVRPVLPGSWPVLERGVPDLPFLAANVALPPAGTPRTRIVESRWREVDSLPVAPSRGNPLRSDSAADRPWIFGAAYTVGGIHPQAVVTAGRPYIQGGRRGVALRVRPFRWDLDTGRLLVLEELVVEVETVGTGGVNVPADRPAPAAADGYADLRFVNAAPPDKYEPLDAGHRLLLVCADAYVDQVAGFAQWKRECGFTVEVAAMADVGATPADIRAAVSARYFGPAGLTYLILVGDVDTVPTSAGLYEGADDDTYYACVDGDDLYPDLFVSRISARDTDELHTQLNKFIRYERDPVEAGAWYDRALGVASDEGDPTDGERADVLRTDLLDFGYSRVDRVYEPAATGAMIAAAVNDGRSFVNFLGHGSGTSWSTPVFDNDDVHALVNGWAQPWIVDVSCTNGNVSAGECFAEAWLRAGTPAAPQGAVAMYSASTLTPWVPPTVMQEEVNALLVTGRADRIGPLCQHGIAKVLDVYPGDIGRQLQEQYNILGDATLQVRTAAPRAVAAIHDGVLAAGVPAYTVTTDVAAATVTLTAPGVLLAAAVTDAEGVARLVMADPPGQAGEVVLTITGANLHTRRETVPVVVPVSVALSPAQLPVGEAGELRVDVTPQSGAPQRIDVLVEPWGAPTAREELVGGGTAVFPLTPVYGGDLVVRGRDTITGRELFRRTVPVTGAPALVDAGVAAEAAAIALVDSLARGRPGFLRAWAAAGTVDLAVRGAGVDTLVTGTGDTTTVQIVPRTTGTLTVAVLRAGHAAHEVSVPVVEPRALVAGTVTDADSGLGLPWIRVRLWPAGAGDAEPPLLDVETAEDGGWRMPRALPPGAYDVLCETWGYTDARQTVNVVCGENAVATPLVISPRGAVTGTVTDTAGAPLAAVFELYREVNGHNVATVWVAGDGSYRTTDLPAGPYVGVLTMRGYVPRTVDVVVEAGDTSLPLVMEATGGSVLVVVDNLPTGVVHDFPVRPDKHGGVLAPSYAASPSVSGLIILGALVGMGYTAEYVLAAQVDQSDWSAHDLVVVACGDNPDPLAGAVGDSVRAHAGRGGRLLLEGGELAAAHGDDPDLARGVLHIAGWGNDPAAPAVLAPLARGVALGPARILGDAPLTGTGYASADRVFAAPGAFLAAAWADGGGAVVCHDADPDSTAGRTVYVACDLAALAVPARDRLLQNAVQWLLPGPPATASVSGRVELAEGVAATVCLEPGGRRVIPEDDGSFVFGGLVAGAYRVAVASADVAAPYLDVELAPGEARVLAPMIPDTTIIASVCSEPGRFVPDLYPTGIAETVIVEDVETLGEVRVRLDLVHAWSGDLIVTLTSPAGTSVLLRAPQGQAAAAVGGWYPADHPACAGDLAAFAGESAAGTWRLHLADDVPLDEGVLEGWCLEVAAVAKAEEDGDPPRAVALRGNWPNPFNPATTIEYDVPRAGPVELTIYDVRGRRVRTFELRAATPGRLQTVWRGDDDGGRDVAAGVYLVRVKTAEGKATGKMTLLR